MVTLATHLAKIGNLPIDETLAVGLSAVQKTGDTRRGEQGVVLSLERGELLASHVGAATRHHYRGIPSQERERSAEGMEPFELLFELLIR